MQIATTHRLWEQAADKDGSIGWIGFIGSRIKNRLKDAGCNLSMMPKVNQESEWVN